jgi:hypothetical protein
MTKKISMKKVLFAALFAVYVIGINMIPVVTHAQQTNTVATAHAVTAADTITATAVASNVMQFVYTYTETSGTTAGKVYLQGKFLASAWVNIDSLTLADVGTAQTLRTIVTQTSYKDYRWVNTNTSTAVGTATCGYLRRPDER